MRITKTFKQDCKCGWIREGFMIMYSKTKFKTCFLFRQEKLTKELQKSFTWWINTSSIFQIDNMEGLESLDWQWQFFGAKALDHVSFTGHFTFEEKITLLKIRFDCTIVHTESIQDLTTFWNSVAYWNYMAWYSHLKLDTYFITYHGKRYSRKKH